MQSPSLYHVFFFCVFTLLCNHKLDNLPVCFQVSLAASAASLVPWMMNSSSSATVSLVGLQSFSLWNIICKIPSETSSNC